MWLASPSFRQFPQKILLHLAREPGDLNRKIGPPFFQRLHPLRQGPVLFLTSAAGMNDDPFRLAGSIPLLGEFFSVEPMRSTSLDSQRLERTGQISPGLLLWIPGVEANIFSRPSSPFPISGKDPVWIKEIGNRQIKFGEIVGPVRIQLSTRGIKSGQARLVNRTHRIHRPRPKDQLAEFFGRHQLDLSLRPLLPHPSHRGQSQEKVTQRSST